MVKNSLYDLKSQDLTANWLLNYFIRLRDSGALSIMSHSAVSVLVVFLSKRSKEKSGVRIGYNKIKELTGISSNLCLCNALNQLHASLLIESRKRPPKDSNSPNFYALPLQSYIDIDNLKAEVNAQKKRRKSKSYVVT